MQFRINERDGKQATYSDVTRGLGVSLSKPVDCHAQELSNLRGKRASTLLASSDVTAGENAALDFYFWLPAAAEELNISADIKDYVLVPNVPTILSDVPNTNGVAFPKKELLRYHPKQGRQCYKTFKGKPTFVEHANSDHTKACGVIVDCYMSPMRHGRGLAKVVKLLAFDRNKNPDIANGILSGDRNCYSMGSYFGGFYMSDGSQPTQAKLKAPLYANGNDLVYACVTGVEGFETSSVANPAFVSAVNTEAYTL